MSNDNRPRKYSIDGFVPSSGSRRVGFTGQGRVSRGDVQRVRRRPPGAAAPVDRATTSTGADSFERQRELTPQGRSNFPEFTSYSGNGGTGRRRPGRHSGGDADEPRKTGFFRRRNWKKIIKRTSAVLAIVLLLGGGYLGYKLIHASNKVFGDSNLIDFLSASRLKGEDQGRTNILLAGVSTDDPGHEGADLTDSIMLISLDTNKKKAFMLSIPRDLWVNIPGYGYSKINAANVYGDQDKFNEPGYTSGGIGLLEKTLATRLNIPIHYYSKVNYSALRDAVNAVGGIDVNIQSSDPRGLYDPNISITDGGPLKLPNGKQTLNGQTALNLARARGDPCGCGKIQYGFPQSDFNRTQNQRMELLALKDKIASPGVIANPLKLGQLMDALGNNVTSDFKPSEIKRLYDLSKVISSSNIASVSLNSADGKNLLASYTTGDGASALIPAAGISDFSDIQAYLKKLMSSDQAVQESPVVTILNGGDTVGLAGKESNYLTARGFQVQGVADSPISETNTLIIDQSAGKKPNSKSKLVGFYGNNVTTTVPTGLGSYPDADFVIVLGANQKAHSATAGD